MSDKKKKKKNKKKKDYREKYFKECVITEWETLKEDMERMTKKMKKADSKAKKKHEMTEEEAAKAGRVVFNTPTNKQIQVRKSIIELFKDSTFLESIAYVLSHTKNFIKMIGKLFCVLIITLLSIDNIRKLIPSKLLDKIDSLFEIALAV